MVNIYILILRKRTYFKILNSINKELLKSALISIITKQEQNFSIYSKNINGNGNASKYIHKMDYYN